MLRKRRDEEPSEKVSVTDGVVFPAIWRRSIVVGLRPTPTVPLARTVRRDAPEEDATLSGLMPGFPCTLRLNDEDEALTPSTVPLSIRVEVPTVVADNHRVA